MPTSGPLLPVGRVEDHLDGVAVEEATEREIFESETGENHSGSGETVGSRSQPGRRG